MDNQLQHSGPQRQPGFRRLFCIILSILVLLAASPATASSEIRRLSPPLLAGRSPAALAPDPTIQNILNQVQTSALSDTVAQLSGEKPITVGGSAYTLATRSTSAGIPISKATQFAAERLQAPNLTVSYHTYDYLGGERRNVVAEQPGSNSSCIYLLTAHLDNTSSSPNTLAPGADDNASGSAAVLTAASILRHYQFSCTIRYILFTGEEQGLYGSDAYAQDAKERGDPIKGVLNMDMIAYNSPGSSPVIELDIRTGQAADADRVLTDMIVGVVAAYKLNLVPKVYTSYDDGSDQYSFWVAGFPGVEIIEDWNDHTPYYHTTSDRLNTLDLAYFTDFTKAVTGALAHLAGLAPSGPLPPPQAWLPVIRK